MNSTDFLTEIYIPDQAVETAHFRQMALTAHPHDAVRADKMVAEKLKSLYTKTATEIRNDINRVRENIRTKERDLQKIMSQKKPVQSRITSLEKQIKSLRTTVGRGEKDLFRVEKIVDDASTRISSLSKAVKSNKKYSKLEKKGAKSIDKRKFESTKNAAVRADATARAKHNVDELVKETKHAKQAKVYKNIDKATKESTKGIKYAEKEARALKKQSVMDRYANQRIRKAHKGKVKVSITRKVRKGVASVFRDQEIRAAKHTEKVAKKQAERVAKTTAASMAGIDQKIESMVRQPRPIDPKRIEAAKRFLTKLRRRLKIAAIATIVGLTGCAVTTAAALIYQQRKDKKQLGRQQTNTEI